MKVEVATGLKMETFTLYLLSSEKPLGANEVLAASSEPSELHLLVLQKVELAAVAGVADAAQLTNEQLAQACSSPEAQGEIIALNGCSQISDMSCLAQLEQMQVLDATGCSSMDGTTLASAIKGLK